MPFQLSDIKISGTIDDISFYNSVFGWLVRRKGGPTRKQFKTSPNFERSRENSSEFTTCSKAASFIRTKIIQHTGIKNKSLYKRLQNLMYLLLREDTNSPRGSRNPMNGMLSATGQSHLKAFEVLPGLSLYNILLATGQLTAPEKKKTPALKRKKRVFIFRSPSFKLNLRAGQKQVPFNKAFG